MRRLDQVPEARHPSNVRVALAGSITVVCWASAFAAIRVGLQSYTPAHVALLRYLVASLVLGGIAVVSRMPMPQIRDMPRIALIGLVGITFYNVALNYGEMTVPAATASFLIASAPVWMALLASFIFRERLNVFGWIGTGISFVGVAIIAQGMRAGLQISTHAWIVLAAALAQSFYSLAQKPLLTRYSPLQCTAYAIWAGTLFLLPFGSGLLGSLTRAPLSASLAVVYMGIFPGALGYAMWAYVLSRIPAARAGGILYLIPALALVIGWGWLGELPTLVSLVGGVLVVTGVVLLNTRGKIVR